MCLHKYGLHQTSVFPSRRLWRCCAAGDFGCQLRWNVDVEGRRPTNVGPSQKSIGNMDRSDDLKFQSDDFYLWMEKKSDLISSRQAQNPFHISGGTILVFTKLKLSLKLCQEDVRSSLLKSESWIWCHRYDMKTWWHVKTCIPYLCCDSPWGRVSFCWIAKNPMIFKGAMEMWKNQAIDSHLKAVAGNHQIRKWHSDFKVIFSEKKKNPSIWICFSNSPDFLVHLFHGWLTCIMRLKIEGWRKIIRSIEQGLLSVEAGMQKRAGSFRYQEPLLQLQPRWHLFSKHKRHHAKRGWSQPGFSRCWTAVNRRNWTVDMSGTTTKAFECAPEGRYASELELQSLQAMLCKLVHVRQVVVLQTLLNTGDFMFRKGSLASTTS